jgi:hypothetical protein
VCAGIRLEALKDDDCIANWNKDGDCITEGNKDDGCIADWNKDDIPMPMFGPDCRRASIFVPEGDRGVGPCREQSSLGLDTLSASLDGLSRFRGRTSPELVTDLRLSRFEEDVRGAAGKNGQLTTDTARHDKTSRNPLVEGPD